MTCSSISCSPVAKKSFGSQRPPFFEGSVKTIQSGSSLPSWSQLLCHSSSVMRAGSVIYGAFVKSKRSEAKELRRLAKSLSDVIRVDDEVTLPEIDLSSSWPHHDCADQFAGGEGI